MFHSRLVNFLRISRGGLRARVSRVLLGCSGFVLLPSPFLSYAANAMPLSTKSDNFTESPSGMKYRDIKKGSGAVPTKGENVKVHYTGWLDGFDGKKKFDSSLDRGVPLEFAVGTGRVIAGWDEALLSMPVGSTREVIIPPHLGYGESGAGGVIPPNATLYFRMELVDVAPVSFVRGMVNKILSF